MNNSQFHQNNDSILTGIKLVASEEGLTLTSSDSKFLSKYSDNRRRKITINDQEPGSIVLPARFFGEIVKYL